MMVTSAAAGTPGPDDECPTGFAVDRYGSATLADLLASLLREADLEALGAAIDEFGLQMVAEQYLAALIDGGTLRASEAVARAEEDRLLSEDPHASPAVRPITVADLADEFTRLGLTSPATSCG